jgi:hypothetical protein
MGADPDPPITGVTSGQGPDIEPRLERALESVAAQLQEPELNVAERVSAAILVAGGVGLALTRLLRRGAVPPLVYGTLGVSALYSAFGAARSELMRQRRLMRQQTAT